MIHDALTLAGSLGLLLRLRRRLRWTRQQLRTHQLSCVQRLVAFAYENTPLYRELYDQAGIHPSDIRSLDDFSNLPTVDKATMREAFPERIVARAYRNRHLFRGATSGSTGEPLRFVLDSNTVAHKIAGNLRAMQLTGYRPGRDRLLQISPHARIVGDGTRRIGDRLLRRQFLDPFQPNFDEASRLVRRFRPTAIFGYTSFLRAFAEHLIDRGDRVPVRLVLTTSETQQDHDRKLISDAFQAPVYDQYGSTEFGRVATEYPGDDGMLVFTDINYVETCPIADAEHDDIDQLVLTSLKNFAMPFIRYRIGDLGVLNDAKPDAAIPFPTLTRIQGRIHDMLVRPDGTRIVPEFVHRVLREFEEIQRYQLIQHSPDRLELRVRLRCPLADSQAEELRSQFRIYMGDVQLELTQPEKFLTKAGKFQHVVGYPVVGLAAEAERTAIHC